MCIAAGLYEIGRLMAYRYQVSRLIGWKSEFASYIIKIPRGPVSHVIAQPANAREIAEKLIPYIREYIWNPHLDLNFVRKISPLDIKLLINSIYVQLQKIGERNIRLAEAIDILLEHFIVRLRWVSDNPEGYVHEMLKFSKSYENDAKEYVLLLTSSTLLLRALSKTKPLWSLQKEDLENRDVLIRKFVEIVEELESYTATFQLMKEPINEKKIEIIGEVKSLEELWRTIGLE